ncbi:MAG: XTP/dITP diphosphatase [Clostridiales bacterium]|nr:XTP/dITP diphosphatase [Clostridiales bacterium]
MNTLLIATKNQGKVKEIKEILWDLPYLIKSLEELKIDVDVMEDGDTYEENALKKAEVALKISGIPTMADDSGLEIDALGGAPGIYSARFAGVHGDSLKNNNKVLELMKDIPYDKRSAKFVAAVVLLYPDGRKIVTRGEIDGYIANEPAGENGFGYDPLFYVPEYNKTFAELGENIKNKISHRGKALRALKEKLKIACSTN